MKLLILETLLLLVSVSCVTSRDRGMHLQAYLVKKPIAITTPFVARKKSSGKKDRGYDAKVGVVDSTRVGRAIFRFYFTELGL